jgi:hypothetical protein
LEGEAVTVRVALEAFAVTVTLFAIVLLLKLESVDVKLAVMVWLPSEVKTCAGQVYVRTPATSARGLEQKGVPGATESVNETEPDCGSAVPV